MSRCLNCMKEYSGGDVCPHCGFKAGTTPREAYHLHPGTRLAGRYIIGTTLGFGGFGITYRAWDETLGKMIAIKEYYPNGIVNRIPGESAVIIYSGKRQKEFMNGKERFLEEARNMAKFNQHPNVVHVYNFFEENHTAYIAMEFLDGISYKQFIASNGGSVDVDTAVGVVLAVLSALKELHKNRIIHRDISPDNIFICADGTIKLIDFGAARFTTGEKEKTMSIILKPGYAPPEQYRSKSRQGPWTDIYAVGAVLYRSVTGVMPEESVNRQISDSLKAPSELNPNVPQTVNNAIKRAMALDWELRFKSAGEFEAALESQAKVRDDKEELALRKRRRFLRIGGLCACLCAAAGLCFGLYQKKAAEARLKPAELLIWLPAADEEADRAVIEEMVSEYRENNSQIELTFQYIPEEEYEEELRAALDGGEGPSLFDSTCLGAEYSGQLADLSGILSPEELAGYYYLDAWENGAADKTRIPLAVQMPVLYVNQMLGKEPEGLESPEALKEDGQYSFAINPKSLPLYRLKGAWEGIEENQLRPEDGQEAYSLFKGRQAAYYLSDTSDIRRIQEDMAGVYSVYLVTPEQTGLPAYARFSNLWSVSKDCGEAERKAAMRLLYYMLSERAQTAMCVKGKQGVPLNRNAFERYMDLNPELSGIGEVSKEDGYEIVKQETAKEADV